MRQGSTEFGFRLLVSVLVGASLLSGVAVSQASASIQAVTIGSDFKLPAPRWMFGQGEAPKGNDPATLLALVKQAQLNGDFDSCVDRSKSARAKAKSLHAWISVVELDCAAKIVGAGGKPERLASALETTEKSPTWFLTGPQASLLRQTAFKGYLVLIEHDTKSNRTRAARSIEKAQELSSFVDEKGRAKLWQLAGELAFVMQKPEAARDFFRRSLREAESDESRARLSTIEAAISAVNATVGPSSGAAKKSQTAAAPAPKAQVPFALSLESSPEEIALVDRVTTALKAGELIAAVQDAAKLVQDFPGGTRAKWASDRIWEAYVSIADKSDPKFTLLREQMVKQMEKVDGDRLFEWARLMYNRGQYGDSFSLAKKSLETLSGTRSTRALELLSEAAIATEKYEDAREALSALVTKHAGTPASREALLRSGLLNYRLGKHAQAVSELERLLVLPQIENHELIARHWLWRSLQKLGSPRADQVADEMMQKYPFSYYGLRARLERNGNTIDLKPILAAQENGKVAKVESQLWLTGHEVLAWERMQLLLKAGWLDEAQAELRELPQPIRAEDKAVRALIWAAAANFVMASKLANEAWDEKAELRRPPFIGAAFPVEFDEVIGAQASARKVDRYLIKGLIKQESGYNVRATSVSNALGLMQIIPPTAKEIATELKMGELVLPDDMFVPQRNIQMGTYYISRMLSKFQGNVPLALAAYNAGPARMERWLRSRPSLKNLPSLRSSAPDDELWFDEIPYSETSFYVKAILRNILLYRLLDQGRVEAANPVWAFDAGS